MQFASSQQGQSLEDDDTIRSVLKIFQNKCLNIQPDYGNTQACGIWDCMQHALLLPQGCPMPGIRPVLNTVAHPKITVVSE